MGCEPAKALLLYVQGNTAVHKTTDSNHPYPVYPNLIKNLKVTNVNQVWVADITSISIMITRLPYFIEYVYNQKWLHASLRYRPQLNMI